MGMFDKIVQGITGIPLETQNQLNRFQRMATESMKETFAEKVADESGLSGLGPNFDFSVDIDDFNVFGRATLDDAGDEESIRNYKLQLVDQVIAMWEGAGITESQGVHISQFYALRSKFL